MPVSGIVGLLALGLFDSSQWLAQLAGVATLLGFVLPLTYGLNWLLNRFSPQRVEAEGERHGMDLHELGAGAYPEFITHNGGVHTVGWALRSARAVRLEITPIEPSLTFWPVCG